MKIDNTIKTNSAQLGSRVKAEPKSDSPSLRPPTDDVTLSPLAGELQADSQAPINSARVAEIKQAIAEGRFSINADAIAGQLIDTARELINSQRRA